MVRKLQAAPAQQQAALAVALRRGLRLGFRHRVDRGRKAEVAKGVPCGYECSCGLPSGLLWGW